MTCIIGYLQDDKIYMGADSAGSSGYSTRARTDEKVFIRDNMIFGFTSSFRMGQLLKYSLVIPKHDAEVDTFEYLCTTFITAVIKCFRDNGFLTTKDGVSTGGVFLLGYQNKLYKIESDFQVGQITESFDACGCGEDFALGAMNILANEDINLYAGDKIRLALNSAAKFSSWVSEPFIVKCLKV